MAAKKTPKFESYQQSNFKNQWSFNSWNFEGKKNKNVQEKHTYCASMLGIIYDDPALHFISQT